MECEIMRLKNNLRSGVLFFRGERKKSNARLGGQSGDRRLSSAILSRCSEKRTPDRRLTKKVQHKLMSVIYSRNFSSILIRQSYTGITVLGHKVAMLYLYI